MKKITALIMAIVMCAITAVITFQVTMITTDRFVGDSGASSTSTSAKSDLDDYIDGTYITKELLDKLQEVANLYNLYYVDPIDPDYFTACVMSGFIAGAKDQFGYYANAEDYEDTQNDMRGEYYGIGVKVTYNNTYNAIEVLTVFRDSPAFEAGLLPWDLIVEVDGVPVSEIGFLEAVNRMRGPEGTYANFTVYRGNNYSEEVSFSIPRRKVTEVTVSWEMYSMAKDVAVIKIDSFDDKTPTQFFNAINSALNAGAKGFVFDVRSNPGGGLDSVCQILDFLLPEGPIIRIDYKGEVNDTSIDSGASYFDYPSVVLCNQYTASAGELFSSAMQDYGMAKLVGVTTYGKGTMQTVLQLSDGSGVSVTCAYYLPPKSPNYHGVGVVPDVVVEMPEEFANINLDKLTDEQDVQLQAAVATLFEAMNGSNKGDGTLT